MDILIHDRKADSSHSSAFLNEHTISIDRRKSLRLEEFEVVNSSFNGYQILWNNISKKVQIGNVFGIISELEDAIEVGLVRHMRATEDGLIIGIELLSYESQIIYAFSPNATEQKTKCVLVNQDSVLFSSNPRGEAEEVQGKRYAHYMELEVYKKFLEPEQAPEAEFPIHDTDITVREYCNLHGLWKG